MLKSALGIQLLLGNTHALVQYEALWAIQNASICVTCVCMSKVCIMCVCLMCVTHACASIRVPCVCVCVHVCASCVCVHVYVPVCVHVCCQCCSPKPLIEGTEVQRCVNPNGCQSSLPAPPERASLPCAGAVMCVSARTANLMNGNLCTRVSLVTRVC